MSTTRSGYTIHVVSDEEFDKLPYSRAKHALGAADAKTKTAYVRHTGVRNLDQKTLEHEFDEMLQKTSPHEIDGIRYKGFLDVFQPVINVAAILFPPLQPVAQLTNVVSTGININKRGFQPLDAFSLGSNAFGLGGASNPGSQANSLTFSKIGDASSFGRAGTVGSSAASQGFNVANATFAPIANRSQQVAAFGGGTKPFTPNIPGATSSLSDKVQGVGKVVAGSVLGSQNRGGTLPTPQIPGGRGRSPGALSRFGTSLNAAGDLSKPRITEADLGDAFSSVDKNASLRQQQINQQFRGQSPDENTAFSRSLGNIRTGAQREKEQLFREANDANERRFKNSVRQEIITKNSLSDSDFDRFLGLAKTGSDSDIRGAINQDPKEFRNVFQVFL